MSRRNGLLLLLQQMRLAPSAVTFLAVALSMQLAVCIGSQRLDTAQCIGDTGGLVTVKGGKDGRLVVQRSGGLLEAFDASGGKLWSVNLTSDHRLGVYSFGVTNDNDVLVVGVMYDTPEAVLYRVSKDGRRVERVRTYPKMRLCDVGVAPSGAVYLLALSNAIVLDMFHAATHGEVLNQPETVTQPWLHRLNDNGEIVQSSHSVEIPTRSWQEAYDYMSDLQSHKLYFSPAGKPYILDPNKSSLMIADLGDSGAHQAISLLSKTSSNNALTAVVRSFVFVDEHTVAFSTSFADESRLIVGSQVRVQNLLTGSSKEIVAGPENAMPAMISVEPIDNALKLYSSREILAGQPRAAWTLDITALTWGVMR